MNAFREIFGWEIRTGTRRISTWVYFSIGFFATFLVVSIIAGALDELFGALTGGKELANSAYALAENIPESSLLLLSATAAIAGQALYRDYHAGIEQLIYSTPVSKAAFLGGRFAGAVTMNMIVLAGVGAGAALAAASPWVKPEKVVAFDLAAYAGPYLVFVLPNVILCAAIFFALVALTRQMLPVYVGGVFLLIGYLIAGTLLADIENKQLASLIDPFGLRAFAVATEYWSIAEKNSMTPPFGGLILWNRVIWLSVGIVIFALAYRRFRFAHSVEDRGGAATAAQASSAGGALTPALFLARVQPADLPRVTQQFDAKARLTQFWSVATRSFWGIVRNRYFAVILAAGLLFLVFATWDAGALYGTPTWPVTYHIEELLTGTIGTFIIIIIAFYSGELIWADRDNKSHQIADATPVPTSVLFLARLTALSAMIALLLLLMIPVGMVTQAIRGYYKFEIPLYLQALFGIRFVDMVLLTTMAMAIHVLSNHKYLAHLLVIIGLVGIDFIPLLGLERNLYLYAADSGIRYSDMNGWGPFLLPFAWWKAYWLAFVGLLLVVTNLLWLRGEETRLSWRMRLARQRFGRPARVLATAAGISFAGLGGFLYYNTDHVNHFRPSREGRRLTAEREKKYKKYETAPQPRITAVNVRVDLQPREQAMVATGHYVLRNKTKTPIDTIHLSLSEEIQIRSLTFDGAGKRVLADSMLDYYMYRLAHPLAPGDSTVMRFELAHDTRGIPNDVRNTFIVENGTFLSSNIFLPSIGYSEQYELSDDDQRRKEGLKPKDRMRPPTDPATRANSYVGHDADWIDFEATVSTDMDQIALAPGYLQREWTENGRRVFRYTMDTPILNFWAVLSGRYAVKKDKWRDVDIAIYYHPGHTYNLDRMVASVKKSLDYFTENFGPYQHRQVRIVEFPRYASFAQSLPNLIPYSEAVGFIARIRKPEDIDYPFYITAHEVAHAWWAHQVIGADAQGSTMLSETLAQYSALMVMEKEYGARNMRKFLAYELDRYLASRGFERKREMPLQLVENQPYIHYNKGSLVMYALRDYIGEDRVNRTLKRFLDETKFKGPPYPTSLQLVSALRAETPDSLKYLITDLFETITLYELRADSAVVTDAPGQPGKFKVDFWANAKKLRADSLGKETEIAMRDWIDVGVYARPKGDTVSQDKNGTPLYLAKQPVDSGPEHFTIVVDQRPSRVGIDPLHRLTDRLTRDNTVSVRDRSKRTVPKPARRDSAARDSIRRDTTRRAPLAP